MKTPKKRTPEQRRRYDNRTILIPGTSWTVGHQIRFWEKELAKNRKKKV